MTAWSSIGLPRAPAMRRGAMRALCALLVLGAVPCLAGPTYKWVDERGRVHFTDKPPEGIPYEAIEPLPHGAVPDPAAPLPPRQPAPEPRARSQQGGSDAGAADGLRCVDALYQIALLNQHRRVFKPGPEGARRYLDNADRPAELERLHRIRDQSCSADPEARAAQQGEATRLMLALSQKCSAARWKLERMQDPDSHAVHQDLAEQREFVEKYCPEAERPGVWLGDWVIVRQRH